MVKEVGDRVVVPGAVAEVELAAAVLAVGSLAANGLMQPNIVNTHSASLSWIRKRCAASVCAWLSSTAASLTISTVNPCSSNRTKTSSRFMAASGAKLLALESMHPKCSSLQPSERVAIESQFSVSLSVHP
eukprot:1229691-Prymnesium_polylepis.1